MNHNRNLSIDAIKGVAITLVMLGHVFVHNFMEDPYLYDFIKVVQMPLFMIVSGYLCGAGRRVESLRQYGQVLKKRAIAYLIPIGFWLALLHPTDAVNAFGRIFFQLDYGLWFLAVLFILTFFVCTAQLAASLFRGNRVLSELAFLGVYGCFCLILVVQCLVGNTFLSPSLTLLYVPFYMLGYVTGRYLKPYLCWGTKETGKLDCRTSPVIRSGVLVMTAVLVWTIAAKDLDVITGRMDTILQMAASLFGSLAVIYAILLWREGKSKHFFAMLGRNSMEIYVTHYHFAYLLNLEHRPYEFYTVEGMLFVAASFVVMCLATWLCIMVLRRFSVTNLLAFGKWERKSYE